MFAHSLIKTLNDLLSEMIDVNLKSNGEVIKRAVSILKTLSDFINMRKKQQKKKQQEEEKKEQLNEEGKQQNEDMPDSSENVDMQNEESGGDDQPI